MLNSRRNSQAKLHYIKVLFINLSEMFLIAETLHKSTSSSFTSICCKALLLPISILGEGLSLIHANTKQDNMSCGKDKRTQPRGTLQDHDQSARWAPAFLHGLPTITSSFFDREPPGEESVKRGQ